MKVRKRMTNVLIIFLGAIFIMLQFTLLTSCVPRPKGIDDPMPQIWENERYIKSFKGSKGDIDVSLEGATQVTVQVDEFDSVFRWTGAENLENIYVEEGHPEFVSEDGVLYSKSYETLVRWPAKKPVTQPKECIKYFAPRCYKGCEMPEDFELPEGTISIGASAFYESTLTSLHVKSNVKTVGGINTESLKYIEISAPIVYRSFFSGQYVESIKFNEGVKEIRMGKDHTRIIEIMLRLQQVSFPESLEVIGNVCFPVSIAVSEYKLGGNIKFLDKLAFHDYLDSSHKILLKGTYGNHWRKVSTKFEYSGQTAQTYFGEKIPKWEKNWSDYLNYIENIIREYKEQGSDASAKNLEDYLNGIKNKEEQK